MGEIPFFLFRISGSGFASGSWFSYTRSNSASASGSSVSGAGSEFLSGCFG